MKRYEYTILGRINRASWKPMKYDKQFNKWEMFKRRIKSFLDTPRCQCPEYCLIHKAYKKEFAKKGDGD